MLYKKIYKKIYKMNVIEYIYIWLAFPSCGMRQPQSTGLRYLYIYFNHICQCSLQMIFGILIKVKLRKRTHPYRFKKTYKYLPVIIKKLYMSDWLSNVIIIFEHYL